MEILVDSSVWVQYFNFKNPRLRELLKVNKAVTNDVILMELLPFLRFHRNHSAVGLIDAIHKIPLAIDWQDLQDIRIGILKNGINNVAIPDLIILQQALQNSLPICSLDKHFKLMQEVFDFELIEG